MENQLSLYMRFESVVTDLFRQLSLGAISIPEDKNWDLTLDGQIAVEIKYYRTARLQIDLVRRAAFTLLVHTRGTNFLPLLVVACNLPDQHRAKLEAEIPEVCFVDRADILLSASRFPDQLSILQSLLDDELNDDGILAAGQDIATRVKRYQSSLSIPPKGSAARELKSKGEDLCKELRKLPCGRDNWRKYEALCGRIVDYLFGSHFIERSTQKVTDDGLSRYDLVGRATPQTDFWEFVITELSSRYVVFEFKNYCNLITQGQILTTEKYLLGPALRRCSIIFCRKGASKSAKLMVRGAVREHGKVMLVLNDDDVCSMLHMKDAGLDPTDFLFQRADEIFMTLSR